MNNQAKWIWKNDFTTNDYAVLFKDITIDSQVRQASIKISAHNHFKLRINGCLVSGYVSPCPSVANKVKYYLEYNIIDHLQVGLNHFEVDVLYLGGDGQNYINAFPGMIAQIFIKTDLSVQEILTDESWEYYEQIPYKSNTKYQQNRRITPIEFYDSRITRKLSSKCNVGLSEMNNIQPNLHKQPIKEGVTHSKIKPKLIYEANNMFVFDAGKIVSGFVGFKLEGVKNQIIKVRYSEDLLYNRVKHNVANEVSENYYDIYVMNDKSIQDHQFDFTYKAFRYFEIEGYPKSIFEEDVYVIHAGTDIDYKGYVNSEDCTWINQLNDAVKNTQLNNVLGQIVDCPHREQAQYLGDTYLQSKVLLNNTEYGTNQILKTLDDFSLMLHEDGTLPFVAPTNESHEDFKLKIPEYNLYYILLLNELYEKKLEIPNVKYYYQISIQIMDYFIRKIDHTGLVEKLEDWHIDDWPYPRTDLSGKYLAFENLLVYFALEILEKFSKEYSLDFNYKIKMNVLKDSIKKYLMVDGLFVDSYMSVKKHPGINAFAINIGFLKDKNEIDMVLKHIIKDNFDSSIILTYHVLEVLLKHGFVEEALTRISDLNRGFGRMLQKDKTLWEGFCDIESHSHAWSGYPLALIQKYIIGITIVNKLLVIKPKITSKIDHLDAKVKTQFGWVKFGYAIQSDSVICTYSMPKNYMAELHFNNQIKKIKHEGKVTFTTSRR
ncbi:family 78 glycoside hydrolase catalytic domain [Candidatus Izemoplasma sp. B36]|uniref:family 78 glycoside hydrolase catalytic domain n=1 Tax=Candidatus Izemoplasma sp. B36 TaxID=3242468 RepID=UPI003555FCC4